MHFYASWSCYSLKKSSLNEKCSDAIPWEGWCLNVNHSTSGGIVDAFGSLFAGVFNDSDANVCSNNMICEFCGSVMATKSITLQTLLV